MINGSYTGNEKFDNIYRDSRDRVFQTALYYTKDKYIAEEIMQDTFLEMYMRIEEIQCTTADNWLLTVVKNKSLNWLEGYKRETTKFENLTGHSEELLDETLEQYVLQRERSRNFGTLGEEIFRELFRENENWYEAIKGIYCYDKTYQEVAEELGVSKMAVYAIIYRARRWIRRKYGKTYEKIFNL